MRISRKAYTNYSIVLIVSSLFIYFLSETNNFKNNLEFYYFLSFTILAINVYITIGRLQDINKSGWLVLLLFIPIINLSFLMLYFVDGTKGRNKYGDDPDNRINPNNIEFENSIKINSLEEINEKLKILEEADNNIFTKEEKKQKIDELQNQKRIIIKDKQTLNDFKSSKEKLDFLLSKNILTKEEYEQKLTILKYDFKINEYDFVNLNSMFYYISEGVEHGPISLEKIINLSNNNKINSNSYIRLINEKEYSKRLNEIMSKFRIKSF